MTALSPRVTERARAGSIRRGFGHTNRRVAAERSEPAANTGGIGERGIEKRDAFHTLIADD
jgi:hypothetical protein